jgi:hypothetical protein
LSEGLLTETVRLWHKLSLTLNAQEWATEASNADVDLSFECGFSADEAAAIIHVIDSPGVCSIRPSGQWNIHGENSLHTAISDPARLR